MAKAQEIALQVLPHFRQNLLARSVRTYGWYAAKIGRDPAREAIVVGQAMHAIGAVCVLRKLPIAPLFYVEAESGNPRQVFQADALEAALVLPNFDLLVVVAREHHYTDVELDGLERALRAAWIEKSLDVSPRELWRMILTKRPKGETKTYFDLALEHYRRMLEALKEGRKAPPRH